MRDLTDRQALCLQAIKAFIAKHTVPPTLRELGDLIGINSTNGVNDHVKALIRKGYLEAPDGSIKSRGIRLAKAPPVDAGLPEPFERLRRQLAKVPGDWEVRGRYASVDVQVARTGTHVCSLPSTDGSLDIAVLIAEMKRAVPELLERYDLVCAELERMRATGAAIASNPYISDAMAMLRYKIEHPDPVDSPHSDAEILAKLEGCGRAAAPEVEMCDWCGELFPVAQLTQADVTGTAKFCSPKCGDLYVHKGQP